MKANRKKNNLKFLSHVDFDIHGILGIRLINANEANSAAFQKQIGIQQKNLEREPDIIITFLNKLIPPELTLLGLHSAGFSKDNFYIISNQYPYYKTQISFEQIGNRCEIVCEAGLSKIPLLNHIINFTLIKKRYVPIHASAFKYKNIGVLVPAWKTGGKTEALLTFANQGAEYIGDEWIVLSEDGESMFGIPVPTSIKDWQFQYISNLLKELFLKDRFQIWVIHFLEFIYKTSMKTKFKNFFMIEILGKMLPHFKRQLKVWKIPQKFFPHQNCEKVTSLDKIFLILMSTNPSIHIEKSNSEQIAQMMAVSNEYEQQVFYDYYRAYKFAFPDKKNEFLERIPYQQNNLLNKALRNKTAYKIYRPYPFSFDELFQKMKPLLIN